MNAFLNFGFLLLPVAIATRYFSVQRWGINFFDIRYLQQWEMAFYGAAALWFALSFWNYFVRVRCTNCRSAKVARMRSDEVDRWVGTKKVTENLGNGKSTQRTVSTTFVKIAHRYACLICDHRFVREEKREKT
jgi:hypothetical protein